MAFPKLKSLKKRFPSFGRRSSTEVDGKSAGGSTESGATGVDSSVLPVEKDGAPSVRSSRSSSLLQSVKKDVKAALNRVVKAESSVSTAADVSSTGSSATGTEEEEVEEVLKVIEATEQQRVPEPVEKAAVQEAEATSNTELQEEEEEVIREEKPSPIEAPAASVSVEEEDVAAPVAPKRSSSSSSYAGVLAVVLLSAVAVGAVVVLRARAVARK